MIKNKFTKKDFIKYLCSPAIAVITAWGMTQFYLLFGWNPIFTILVGYYTAYLMYEVLNK